jgi:endonuclease/exonuclease/phosphatase family metal-dependent hydrolase
VIRRILFLLFVCLPTCVQKSKSTSSPLIVPSTAITVMTLNVENLFDIEDDPLKKDEAYLPLGKKNQRIIAKCGKDNTKDEYRLKECLTKDWSDAVLSLKLQRLTDVIRQVRDGRGPDILILQEVENVHILERWRKEYLSSLNYKPALLIEGPDERGIDVGILTRLESMGPVTLHLIPFVANENLKPQQIRQTRGILETLLKLPDGTPITIFGVHFPSQGAPSETRRQAVEFLNRLKAKLPAERLVIAGGDFNITSDEDLEKGYISKNLTQHWGVSHLLGCKQCLGTAYYHKTKTWSFFDILLVSKNMLMDQTPGWFLLPESIRIENKSIYQKNRYGSPARFSENEKEGVTDHWPVVLELMKR